MSAAEYAEALAALTIATADRVRELVEAGDLDGALRASLDGSAAVEKLSADYHRSHRAHILPTWRTQRIALPVSPDAAPVEVPVVADVNSSGEPVWTAVAVGMDLANPLYSRDVADNVVSFFHDLGDRRTAYAIGCDATDGGDWLARVEGIVGSEAEGATKDEAINRAAEKAVAILAGGGPK